jgi:hypothetical protein
MNWEGCTHRWKKQYQILRTGETDEIHETPRLVPLLKLNKGLPKYEAVISGIMLLNDLHLNYAMHICIINIKGKS